MIIESRNNIKFKSLMKLKQKKYRDQTGLFLVYGKTLVDLALNKGIVDEIYTTNPNIKGTKITKSLMDDLSQTETTYDCLALCRKTENKISSDRVLVLEDIQDPTNVGALLRSALAFSFNHVILSNKCADIYNDKTIRASGGALFDLYIERKDIYEEIINLKKSNYIVYGADAHQGKNKIDKKSKSILILGNEGIGLTKTIKNLIDQYINIDTSGVESLNVSVAGSILMYEWSILRWNLSLLVLLIIIMLV